MTSVGPHPERDMRAAFTASHPFFKNIFLFYLLKGDIVEVIFFSKCMCHIFLWPHLSLTCFPSELAFTTPGSHLCQALIFFFFFFFVGLFKDLLNQTNAQVIVEHKIDSHDSWDSQKCWDHMVLLVVAVVHAWESTVLYAMQYVYLVLHLKIVENIKCFLSLGLLLFSFKLVQRNEMK